MKRQGRATPQPQHNSREPERAIVVSGLPKSWDVVQLLEELRKRNILLMEDIRLVEMSDHSCSCFLYFTTLTSRSKFQPETLPGRLKVRPVPIKARHRNPQAGRTLIEDPALRGLTSRPVHFTVLNAQRLDLIPEEFRKYCKRADSSDSSHSSKASSPQGMLRTVLGRNRKQTPQSSAQASTVEATASDAAPGGRGTRATTATGVATPFGATPFADIAASPAEHEFHDLWEVEGSVASLESADLEELNRSGSSARSMRRSERIEFTHESKNVLEDVTPPPPGRAHNRGALARIVSAFSSRSDRRSGSSSHSGCGRSTAAAQ